jgi:hypothetical protein
MVELPTIEERMPIAPFFAIAATVVTLDFQKVGTRRWGVQKGAQHQITFGRGCAWYAGQSTYYSGSQG